MRWRSLTLRTPTIAKRSGRCNRARIGREPSEDAQHPLGEERAEALRDGRAVLVRPTHASDAALMQRLLFRLRDEDVRTRFSGASDR